MSSRAENYLAGGRCNPTVTPRDEVPDMFATSKPEVQIAEQFCRPCLVITACYNHALANSFDKRVRGGVSFRKLNAIRRYLNENPGTIPEPQPRV